MAKNYNQSLATANDITVRIDPPYYKNPNCKSGCNLNVYVANIDDLLVGGTVNVRFGETDDYDDIDKNCVFKYINGGQYSD